MSEDITKYIIIYNYIKVMKELLMCYSVFILRNFENHMSKLLKQ